MFDPTWPIFELSPDINYHQENILKKLQDVESNLEVKHVYKIFINFFSLDLIVGFIQHDLYFSLDFTKTPILTKFQHVKIKTAAFKMSEC